LPFKGQKNVLFPSFPQPECIVKSTALHNPPGGIRSAVVKYREIFQGFFVVKKEVKNSQFFFTFTFELK
jgi:hypothetical protein